MQRMIIDTDMGVDDAFALMLALAQPDVRVEAITTVFGNVSVEQATRNTFTVLDLFDHNAPVFQGRANAILRSLGNAEVVRRQEVHGTDGLSGMAGSHDGRNPEKQHAVDALVERIMSQPGQLDLVTLGPLTNVALALLREPAIAQSVRHIYMMGGTANALGNITPSAEFNAWMDPEAAQIVFESGAPITMIGWELVWDDMLVTPAEIESLRQSGNPRAQFAVDCSHRVVKLVEATIGRPALSLPDAIAMAVAIDDSICRREHLYVAVETDSLLTRGETVVDRNDRLKQSPNAWVCFNPDAARFKQLLFNALTGAA